MKNFIVGLVLTIAYLILGNIVGLQAARGNCPVFLETLFAPYTFVAGMSAFAGWDIMSFLLEIVIFLLTLPIFFGLAVASGMLKSWVLKRRNERSG